jgi:hypothetical protein
LRLDTSKHGEWNENFWFHSLTCLRLTAAKENGASITVDGKHVALGIPGGGNQENRTAMIPLQRGASPDEAAAAVLLYVSTSLLN